jgi:hypothetical protein
MQALVEGQDTPVRLLSSTLAGFAVGVSFHALPFHASPSISGRFELFT